MPHTMSYTNVHAMSGIHNSSWEMTMCLYVYTFFRLTIYNIYSCISRDFLAAFREYNLREWLTCISNTQYNAYCSATISMCMLTVCDGEAMVRLSWGLCLWLLLLRTSCKLSRLPFSQSSALSKLPAKTALYTEKIASLISLAWLTAKHFRYQRSTLRLVGALISGLS